MKRYWFLRFFKRSLAMRKGKVLIASVSVMFAVMTVTSMLGITAGIREKLGSELRAYGANIMVSSSEGEGLDYSLVDRISGLRQVMDVSGQVFSRAVIGNRSVEIIGLNTGALKEKAWRVDGRRPDKKGEVMAGVNLKMALDLSVGRGISVQAEGGPGDYVIVGFHETGGAEDNSFVMSIQDAWDLTGLPERLDAILVNGESGALDNIVEDIKRTVPGASVKTIRQVALAEQSILEKMQLLMIIVTGVVLLASGISVASTMGANVLQRREEIGLMKAIGATRREISSFYLLEMTLIGTIGGVSGFLFGFIMSQAISQGAFNSFIDIPMYMPLFSIITGILLSLLSACFPVLNALKYNPAVVLREE